MADSLHTPLYNIHKAADAKLVDFAGWEMPIQYPDGISVEHLATRKGSGIFDVSHMGRFFIGGSNALPFLQYILTNNAAALSVGKAQYTIVPNEEGGAMDDAFLYRFVEDEFLLVVNASNREKNWLHFQEQMTHFNNVELTDRTIETAMISLQGPLSEMILKNLITKGSLPAAPRNSLSLAEIDGMKIKVARTGYTGEGVCFELLCSSANASTLWTALTEQGAKPIGLGARDTLRLEASLPLYGHELGLGPYGEIPIFSLSLAKFAVSFDEAKGEFIGKSALKAQAESTQKKTKSLALTGKGIARQGCKVYKEGKEVGTITSGTMVPHWITQGEGENLKLTAEKGKRVICLGLIDSDVVKGDIVQVEIRNKMSDAVIVPNHIKVKGRPFTEGINLS